MVMKSMWNTLLTSCGMKISAEKVKTNRMNFVIPVLDQLSTQSASICALSLINPLLSAITVQGLITNRMIAGCFTQKGSTNCIEISSARIVMPTWLFLVMTCVRVVELDLLFELYYLPVWFRQSSPVCGCAGCNSFYLSLSVISWGSPSCGFAGHYCFYLSLSVVLQGSPGCGFAGPYSFYLCLPVVSQGFLSVVWWGLPDCGSAGHFV